MARGARAVLVRGTPRRVVTLGIKARLSIWCGLATREGDAAPRVAGSVGHPCRAPHVVVCTEAATDSLAAWTPLHPHLTATAATAATATTTTYHYYYCCGCCGGLFGAP